MERDPGHPQDQPDLSDHGCALFSWSTSYTQHIHTWLILAAFVISLVFIAGMSSCVVQVLGFSNLALRDPWPTLVRSSQAYTPSYSLTLRYGLAATLWLCIGLLQVKVPPFIIISSFAHFLLISHFMSFFKNWGKYSLNYKCRELLQKTIIYPPQVIFFTVFYEHFVEDKIRQFVDLCSISNVSSNAYDIL